MGDSREIKSLERQLHNRREALSLIKERKSAFVLDVDIPIGLIKEERDAEEEITILEERITFLRQNPRPDPDNTPPNDNQPMRIYAALGVVIVILVGFLIIFFFLFVAIP